MKEFPRRFLSIRDKNGSHRRSKSVPPGHKDKVRLFYPTGTDLDLGAVTLAARAQEP